MDNKIASKVIRRRAAKSDFSDPTPDAPHVERKHKPSVAEQVAESPIYTRNWKFDHDGVHFPVQPHLRTVDKYFPYARGGPLLVDEPYSDSEIEECKIKAIVLKKMGFRYIMVTKGMDVNEANFALHGVS